MQRALGKGREGADLLDLVAEELDAERLTPGRGKDVDDPASHGELTPLIDPIDTLVPCVGERLRQPAQTWLFADDEADRARTNGMGWHPLGKRRGRGTHEAAPGEDVEGPRPLADEVRRWLETRRVRDTATREQGDEILTEEPRRSFGGIARIRILGQEDEKAASELLMERCEDERERGLGHTCATGQRSREGLEPLTPG